MDAMGLQKRLNEMNGNDLHALCRQLLKEQPQARQTLDRLEAQAAVRGGYGAFAPVEGGRCTGCNMSVATARLQQLKAGAFINCAHCMRFLYIAPK